MTDTIASQPLTFVPFGDRMIVRVINGSNRTKGGLVVPDMALENTPFIRAEVLFVGPGRFASNTGAYVPVQFQPGAVVVFFRKAQEQLVIPDDEVGAQHGELMIISEGHVAWEVRGLNRVSGLVDDSGRNMVLQ